jgi:hypothetical protein
VFIGCRTGGKIPAAVYCEAMKICAICDQKKIKIQIRSLRTITKSSTVENEPGATKNNFHLEERFFGSVLVLQ